MYDRDKGKLYPPFAEMLTRLEERLRLSGLHFHLFEGYRSHERQAECYAKGRTTTPIGPQYIVTNAEPGESWHQFALAADYVLDGMPEKPGIQWSWELRKDLNKDGSDDWLQLASLAVQCGLETGARFPRPDFPHVQHKFALTLHRAQELYKRGGLPAVWVACDERLTKETV